MGESNTAGTTDMFRVTNVTLGNETNSPLDYALGLELHHPIVSKLGDPRGLLERKIEIFYPSSYA